jgi:hypothetical protein
MNETDVAKLQAQVNGLEGEVAALRTELAAITAMRGDMLDGMRKIQELLATFQDKVAAPGPRRVGTEDLLLTLAKDRTRIRAVAERLDELTSLVVRMGETQQGMGDLLEALRQFLSDLRGGDQAA